MKILVALSRAIDPENANRVQVSTDGSRIDCSGLAWKTNPFDEYALETALRLTECGTFPQQRKGEVVVVSVGPIELESVPLRHSLALGADRAVRVDANEPDLDGDVVAKVLCALAGAEKPDLVLLGKQSVDTEFNQVGQRLAELLDWPMATSAATILEETKGTLRVGREVDRGVQTVRLMLPAVVTVDLRIVAPSSVRSRHTGIAHEYPSGVRYAPLPAILKAKAKPLRVQSIDSLLVRALGSTRCARYSIGPARTAGRILNGVEELLNAMAYEAKVL